MDRLLTATLFVRYFCLKDPHGDRAAIIEARKMNKERHAAEILALPAAERLLLVEQIWDSLASDPNSVPVPDWHREELDRRTAGPADTEQASTWKDVKRRLQPARRRRSGS